MPLLQWYWRNANMFAVGCSHHATSYCSCLLSSFAVQSGAIFQRAPREQASFQICQCDCITWDHLAHLHATPADSHIRLRLGFL